MGIFDNAVSVVIGNKIVDSITTSDNGVIYERTEHTRLSIDVPLNLTYSDAFSITGHLTTANGTGISGEEVVLKVDGSVMDSTTTTNNGAYSFTQTPVSTGNHNFQVVYAGSNSYGSSESSTVARDVDKETSVLTVSLDKVKYDIGDTVRVTATVTDDEGNPILFYHLPLQINYDGTWKNMYIVSEGSMVNRNKGYVDVTYQEAYGTTWQVKTMNTLASGNNYTESTANVNLNIVTPTLISTSSSNQIIGDGDSTTVTAKLMDQDGDGIKNRTLSYVVKHGNDTLSTGSDTTDSNGEIAIDYTGDAVGKIDVIVSYGSLTSTYPIYDCVFGDTGVDGTATNWTGNWSSTTTRGDEYSTLTHDSDTNVGGYYKSITPSDMIIELDIRANQSLTALLTLRQSSTNRGGYQLSALGSVGEWIHLKLIIQDDTLTAIADGVEKTPQQITGAYDRFMIHCGSVSGNTVDFKNFVIYKPYIDPTPNNIVLTGTKDILTTGETSTLTAKVKNADGYNIDGVQVKFYENNVLKDTITTSGGKAEYTYTGSAKGQVNIKAECGLLQERFVIRDALIYDMCTTNTHNDNMWKMVNSGTLTRYDSYSTVTGNQWAGMNIKLNNSDRIPLNDYVFEFDTLDSSPSYVNLYDNRSHTYTGITSNKHYKIIIDDSKYVVFEDGEQVASVSHNSQQTYNFQLGVNSQGAILKVKDCVFYSA